MNPVELTGPNLKLKYRAAKPKGRNRADYGGNRAERLLSEERVADPDVPYDCRREISSYFSRSASPEDKLAASIEPPRHLHVEFIA